MPRPATTTAMTATKESSTADPTAPGGPVVARITGLRPTLSRTAGRIADAVLRDPARIVELTVTDLAEQSGTSLASVVRFCQDLGLRGFGDLKLRLAREHQPQTPTEQSHGDLLDSVLCAGATALSAARAAIDRESFAAAADTLADAEHLLVLGVGTSAPLAHDAAYRLRSIGLLAEAPADVHVQHVAARLLRPRAACLAISHTGQTRETLAAATAAHDAGATVIAVTSFYRSPLTAISAHTLVAGSSETSHQIEARTSRLVHSALLDALHAAVAQRHPDRTQNAAEHAAHTVADHRI